MRIGSACHSDDSSGSRPEIQLFVEPRRPLAGVMCVTVTEVKVASVQDLYAATYARLVQTVALTCGRRVDAEEAVQEAFVRLLSRWRTVLAYDDPEAWVRLVAMRIAANRGRQERTWRAVLRRAPTTAYAPPPSPARVDVMRALAMLPMQQRQALVLHYYLEQPVDQIARDLRVPVGTVKSRLSRARNALAPLLLDEVTDNG